MMWSPARSPSRTCAANERTSNQASGAPSAPCLGALLRDLRAERITPMGRNWVLLPAFVCVAPCTKLSFLSSSRKRHNSWQHHYSLMTARSRSRSLAGSAIIPTWTIFPRVIVKRSTLDNRPPARSGAGRNLERGCTTLRRAGAGEPDPLDLHDQRLEPDQREHQTGRGRMGKVGRHTEMGSYEMAAFPAGFRRYARLSASRASDTLLSRWEKRGSGGTRNEIGETTY